MAALAAIAILLAIGAAAAGASGTPGGASTPIPPGFAAQGGDIGIEVLATGDSMIQVLDGQLARLIERPGVALTSDARISTGISKPLLLDWRSHAREQVAQDRPDATVVFLGANDGFAMRTRAGAKVECCGARWIAEYARRARAMMRTYARGGEARVYWLLLPQARDGFFATSYPAVNAALRRAARALRRALKHSVRLIHLNRVFTPGGRYRDEMVWHGESVRVRQSDGVHLSGAGAAIAAGIVADRMRADDALRRSGA